eukprot:TRINITY_DN57570_c0_g1_i1.p1 TRINITY_DN57570_c0_g1~~TRINITY_DN57570_c0_g1_i1.p1  ORF type:complete len:231 (+),score=45.87 TRINITY_DN57570_c0_g1_i1:54-746(+)
MQAPPMEFPGAEPQQENKYKGNHPTAAFFHACFKLAAFLTYIIGPIVDETNFVLIFVIVVLLLAADFWTTKNVTGRLMVALRWWNEISEDGQNDWQFESGDQAQVNPIDAKFFWIVLVGNVVIWSFNLLVCIMTPTKNFKWVPLVAIALALSGANCYGYFKCRKDARKRVTEIVTGSMLQFAAGNPDIARSMGSAAAGAFASHMFGQPQPQQHGQPQPPYAGPYGAPQTV